MDIENSNNQTIVMKIDSSKSIFSYEDKIVEVPVGYDLLSEKFFINTPPRPDEIEYAINYIEDEIEKAVKLLPANFTLVSSDSFVYEIALLSDEKLQENMVLSRDKMEYLFGLYSEVSQGRAPFSFQTDLSSLFYAKLLILREFMHHLKFNFLKIINTNK